MSSEYKIRIVKNELSTLQNVRLQISVGQPYHEGRKFHATALWASQNFKNISINLCDTLQRHNLIYHGYTPFAAFDKSLALGKEWLDRNSPALQLISSLKITHWEDWKANREWPTALEKTRHLYAHDQIFFDLVEKSAELFWERRRGKEGYPENKKDAFYTASRNYILEEIAVSMVMSANDIAEIYPGTFPLPLYHLRLNNISAPVSMTSIAFTKKKTNIANAA